MTFRRALLLCLGLSACGPLVQRDLRQEYISQTRAIGMTPVYPPRGEVQVGDVYLVFTPADGGEDAASALWVGRMPSLRSQGLAYLASRDNIGALMPTGNAAAAEPGPMRTLPAVNFPTITGSAASAASLGAVAPVLSGLFSAGSNDTVSMTFLDVRAFGVPYLAASLSVPDFQRNVCPALGSRVSLLQRQLGYNPNDPASIPPCGDPEAAARGQSCRLQVVTRTYLTREIKFSYNQRRRIGASAQAVRALPAPAPVAAIPAQPAVTVAIDANTLPDTATQVITALKAPTSTSFGNVGTVAVSETSQGFALDQKYTDPLAVAYESLAVSLLQADDLCR
jgi:hypothetical protein